MPQHWFERVFAGEINKWMFIKNPPPLAQIAMVEVQLDTDPKMCLKCPVVFEFPHVDDKKYGYLISILESEKERLNELWEKEPPIQKARGSKPEVAKSLTF